jgi:hypothetical protein
MFVALIGNILNLIVVAKLEMDGKMFVLQWMQLSSLSQYMGTWGLS